MGCNCRSALTALLDFKHKTFVLLIVIILPTLFAWSQANPDSVRINRALDAYMRLPTPPERSSDEATHAAKRAAEACRLDSPTALPTSLPRVGDSSSGQHLATLHYLLKRMQVSMPSALC